MSDSHPSHLAHQFDHVEQQKQASLLGMWIFLVTEVMFFGGLFAGYTVYRGMYPEAWVAGSHLLNIKWGGFNTAVLLASSFTMVLAVHAAQCGRRRSLVNWLIATMILGAVFLGVKVIEYSDKIEHHLVPGTSFHYNPADPAHPLPASVNHMLEQRGTVLQPGPVRMFFAFYFTMTGMHAIHMIIGEGILAVMVFLALRGRFSSDYYNPIEITGLYWHFVDIVWVFLFPMLYLIGRH